MKGALFLSEKIYDAIAKGDFIKVETLLKEYPELANEQSNELGLTPLHFAAMDGYKEIVELLLYYKADANSKEYSDMTPLHWAARNGYKDIVELLITRGGAVVNVRDHIGLTPLHYAKYKGYKETVDVLRHHGAKIA